MATTAKFIRDETCKKVDASLYKSTIGILLSITTSHPDICFSVGVCARYQSTPTEFHLTTVKRFIKYLAGTTNFGLWYSCDTNLSLVCFSDSDWVGNHDNSKSTSSGCFYVGNNLVSWHSKKQNSILLSTVEAEYIAAGGCCTQVLWMKQMLNDYRLCLDTLTIYCDNTNAINLSKNPVQHSRTKHIDIRHYFLFELVESKIIILSHVASKNQLAVLITKSLSSQTLFT
ncbi:secreted RxLR effector protein 161-like [Humulus lupulus]|uniref:secreted RxLR effector protein 161-like n=1 Tax=Humulus lupulus TaxID=3486 RepID=UPI002B411332|nr:secreted RxLR effector protein 161-like [Humulus lupulus]